jgi:molybdenum ABC transporter molybdate-binding protein
MKTFLLSFALIWIYVSPLGAQTAVPASPADPNQARPALPVLNYDSVNPQRGPAPNHPAVTNDTVSVAAPTAAQVVVTVIADSSLKQVLQELAQDWADAQDTGPQMPLTLTNAETLRAKVETSPAWDVVISADVADVKAMTDKGALVADGQRSLARNTLVVYGRKALVKDDDLDWFDLIGTEWKKVALGDPAMVASGRVAQRALQKHDLWGEEHKDMYVYAPTDALALAVAQRDQVDAVFAYKTDAARMNLPGFEAVPIDTGDAPPVFYVAAVGRLAKNPALGQAFIDYCGGETAKAVWAKFGFETN